MNTPVILSFLAIVALAFAAGSAKAQWYENTPVPYDPVNPPAPVKYNRDVFTLYNLNTSSWCYHDCSAAPSCPMSCAANNRTSIQQWLLTSQFTDEVQNGCWMAAPVTVPAFLSGGSSALWCFPKNASVVANFGVDNDIHCKGVPGNNPLRPYDWIQFHKVGGVQADFFYPYDVIRISSAKTGSFCRAHPTEHHFSCANAPNPWDGDRFQIIFVANNLNAGCPGWGR